MLLDDWSVKRHHSFRLQAILIDFLIEEQTDHIAAGAELTLAGQKALTISMTCDLHTYIQQIVLLEHKC